MAPKFGTSGLRGLVTELTPALVADHLRGFIAACDTGTALFLGRDLRPSSPDIAAEVLRAAQAEGLQVVDCGALPTPALALAARQAGAAAVMVTGSHIPADRNGLKFYTPAGEITKADEQAILAALGRAPRDLAGPPPRQDHQAAADFAARYVRACGAGALAGRRIGVYSHSAVGRDMLIQMLAALGAEVLEFGRSAEFIPVDTEAVEPEIARQIADWVQYAGLDALVSTDGDSDRPLLADETGRIVPGDIMGQITAQALAAHAVVTPISSNSGVLQKGFAEVVRTAIGSPYVIAGMAQAGARVVGYEANGGFLLGFDLAASDPLGGIFPGPLAALPTRDCMLPLLAVLMAAQGGSVSARVAAEPPVVTLSGRLQEVPAERGQALLAGLKADPAARAAFLAPLAAIEAALDLTDGLRITLQDGRLLHLRPSGNAPEFRLYVEAQDAAAAEDLMARALPHLRALLLGH